MLWDTFFFVSAHFHFWDTFTFGILSLLGYFAFRFWNALLGLFRKAIPLYLSLLLFPDYLGIGLFFSFYRRLAFFATKQRTVHPYTNDDTGGDIFSALFDLLSVPAQTPLVSRGTSVGIAITAP